MISEKFAKVFNKSPIQLSLFDFDTGRLASTEG